MSGGFRSVNVFVAATGNAFMTDIASWLVEAAEQLGRNATLVADGTMPKDPEAINLVVAPHEFYFLHRVHDLDLHRATSISVPVCTEQPGTPWFEMTRLLCGASPMVLDINRYGVDALRAEGLAAFHLRLGAVPSMDRRTDTPFDERPTELLFLGGKTDHRSQRLAELAPVLWNRRTDLRLFSFNRPVTESLGGVVFGDDKYDLLASAQVLLNIHRDPPQPDRNAGYFEWARMVETMANGVAVVTEPSAGFEPLVAGEHFLATDDLGAELGRLLDDPDRAAEMGASAARAVLDEYPLSGSLAEALDAIESLGVLEPQEQRRYTRTRYRSKLERVQQTPLLPAFRPNGELRERTHAAWVGEVALHRRLDAERCALRHGDPDHVERVVTSAYESVDPSVTVIVTLFDYAHLVVETLDSVIASSGVDFEIVIVDDHSRDDGRDVVRGFMRDHDDIAIMLLGCDANHGLPTSRNRAFRAARAEYVMVMDADNLVYPNCLAVLADTLDRDPDAAFAYATLEEFGVRNGLQGAMGWHVPWLCEANYIDAQAMVRRSIWERIDGYRADDALVFGWEDWEFWLRLAAAGERGHHVARILGRYRTQDESMIATSNLFGDLMLAHLKELHPALPWPT